MMSKRCDRNCINSLEYNNRIERCYVEDDVTSVCLSETLVDCDRTTLEILETNFTDN